MRHLALFLLTLPLAAAVNGTVVNRTTGKPVAGIPVSMMEISKGMEPVAEVRTGPDGKFSIARDLAGPCLLQVTHDGINYSKMLPPGSPSTGIELDVFSASTKPGDAQLKQRMLLFEPGNGQLTVTEVHLYQNIGNTTWSDPDKGTLRFYLPPAAKGVVKVNATAPHGMPLERNASRADRGDTWKVDFPIKPGGETRFDLTYLVPYQAGEIYSGKLVGPKGTTRIFTPAGVTIEGKGVKEAGQEPASKANMYEIEGESFQIAFSGAGAMRGEAAEAQETGPRIEQIMPRLYAQAPVVLALAMAILALGFVLLYHAQGPAKEANERRRR